MEWNGTEPKNQRQVYHDEKSTGNFCILAVEEV